MKIKHFVGYGTVNATKLNNIVIYKSLTETIKRVTIKVTGNHEWGLYRNDTYDIYNWIVKRFCKDCNDYRNIINIGICLDYELINNIDTKICIYTIDYIIK